MAISTARSWTTGLCASVDGFTLHAVTQERITQGPDSLVRIALERPFSDGTVAIDLDPLSLLSRLAASVPAPRMHTVRYAANPPPPLRRPPLAPLSFDLKTPLNGLRSELGIEVPDKQSALCSYQRGSRVLCGVGYAVAREPAVQRFSVDAENARGDRSVPASGFEDA